MDTPTRRAWANLAPEDREAAMLEWLDTRQVLEPPEQALAWIDSLPAPLRVLHVLNWFDFEVSMGGLSGYFYNSAGRQAGRTAEALRTIGCPDSADVLADIAGDVLKTLASHPDASTWGEALDDLDLDTRHDDLDQALDAEDWRRQLQDYLTNQIAAHAGS